MVYFIYVFIIVYKYMCFSIIDIYICAPKLQYSVLLMCARMNVEDCLPEKIANSLFTNHLPLTIFDVEGSATPKRSQSG